MCFLPTRLQKFLIYKLVGAIIFLQGWFTYYIPILVVLEEADLVLQIRAHHVLLAAILTIVVIVLPVLALALEETFVVPMAMPLGLIAVGERDAEVEARLLVGMEPVADAHEVAHRRQ